jgi:hypothetical protein
MVYYSSVLNIDRLGDDAPDRVQRGDLLDSTTVFVGALQVLLPPGGGSSSSSKSVWDELPEELVLLLKSPDPVVIAWSAEGRDLILIVSCALRLPGQPLAHLLTPSLPSTLHLPCTSPFVASGLFPHELSVLHIWG